MRLSLCKSQRATIKGSMRVLLWHDGGGVQWISLGLFGDRKSAPHLIARLFKANYSPGHNTILTSSDKAEYEHRTQRASQWRLSEPVRLPSTTPMQQQGSRGKEIGRRRHRHRSQPFSTGSTLLEQMLGGFGIMLEEAGEP